MKRICAIAAIALFPFGAGGQDAPGTKAAGAQQHLSLPQARALARRALANGQPALAYNLADGLLQADRRSPFAHFVQASAQAQMGQPQKARLSAARAYRYADTKLHRFEAAELAARLSYAEQRPTVTQLWLRRAVQNAPDPKIEAQLARDYGRVRAENPLSFSARGFLRPSSNVNNGADSDVQLIDGLPTFGLLSGSAQALSGIIGALDTRVGYRLRGSKDSRTQVGARLYISRVALSSDARALAPDVENADFGSTYGEVSLTHGFAVGTTGSAFVGAAVGQLWFAENKYYSFARLDAGRTWRLDEATGLTIKGSVEQRASAIATLADSTAFSLLTQISHAKASGDRLSFTLDLRHTASDGVNLRNTSTSLRANYSFGKQIGPAKVSAGVVASVSNHPDFTSATFNRVPGGRQDKSIYADLTLFFPDMDYAGFAPTLHVRAGRKLSNVSRYETREVSVSLGVQSKF